MGLDDVECLKDGEGLCAPDCASNVSDVAKGIPSSRLYSTSPRNPEAPSGDEYSSGHFLDGSF